MASEINQFQTKDGFWFFKNVETKAPTIRFAESVRLEGGLMADTSYNGKYNFETEQHYRTREFQVVSRDSRRGITFYEEQ